MRIYIALALAVCFLLTGCEKQEETEPVETIVYVIPETSTSPEIPETPNIENTVVEMERSRIFKITGNTMSDGGQWRINGTNLSTVEESGLTERFLQAELDNGVCPPWNRIALWFEESIPLRVSWSTDDGFDCRNEDVIICDGQSQISFSLGRNTGKLLASDLDNIPNRKLRIICEYPDRSIEYLLIISSSFSYNEQ